MADPVLKWVGGKRRLLPDLLARLPSDVDKRRHVEPFVGGGALFFAREPDRAHLSDANPHLIRFYSALRSYPKHLIQDALEWARLYAKDPKSTYYDARRTFNAHREDDGLDTSPTLLFLNKTCFNGLWRVNRKGEFNVPMGRYDSPTIVDIDVLRAASEALRAVETLRVADFEDVSYEAHDFVYFDPPYVPLDATSNFTSYAAGGFGAQEQRRLRDLLVHLTERGIPCMLSNSDTPLVREMYAGFQIDTVHVGRPVSCKGGGRGKVAEVIVTNEPCRK